MTALVRHIPASGDTSGLTDWTRLTNAIAEYSATGTLWTLVLSGMYYIFRPLVIGWRPDVTVFGQHDTIWPVALIGAGHAGIRYVGETISRPMIAYSGRLRGTVSQARMANLMLDGNWRCRGLHANRVTYGSEFTGLELIRHRELGLDILDCWGSRWSNVFVHRTRGCALRIRECATTTFNGIKANGRSCWHRGDNAGPNMELQHYECQHGREAALAKYGANYEEAWPDPHEQLYSDYLDHWIQMPEAERATVHVRVNYAAFRDFNLEGSQPCEKPALYVKTPMRDQLWDGLYFESMYWRNNAITLAAARGSSSSDGNIRFRRIKAEGVTKDPVLPSTFLESLVRTTGTLSNVEVEDAFTYDLQDAVIMCDGGQLYNSRCQGIRSRNKTIPPSDWIKAKNGGTVSNAVPYSYNHAAIQEEQVVE